jgi:plastocyanin
VNAAKLTALVLSGATVLAVAPAQAGTPTLARRPQKKTVQVLDNYYSPRKLTVNLNSTITWKWPDDTGDVHDVKLVSGPKGYKKFQSEPAAAGYTFKRKLTKPGVYKLLCTFHEADGMRMTITVRQAR